MKFKVAAIQMTVVPENKEENIKKALALYDEAVGEGAKVVCFPEYFLTCPPHMEMGKERVRELAEPIPGPSIEKFREKARSTKTYCVAGSIIELASDGRLFNTSTLIGPSGEIIGKFSKVHPENAPAKHEPGCGIEPGSEYPVFETELGRFAIMIDMDGTCPEVGRIYGLKGADIIFWPINWSAKFIPGIETYSKCASLSSHAYVVFANPIGWRKKAPLHSWAFVGGTGVDLMYGGGTGVALGVYLIARVPNFSEGVALATVDIAKVAEARKNDSTIYPYWRRPETYSILVDPASSRPYGTN